MKKILLTTILAGFLLQGCSAIMALNGSNPPDLGVITKGTSKAVIEAQPLKPVFSEIQANGNTVIRYTYTIGKEPSPGRAAVYVLLDSATIFISELFTMPIEASRKETERSIFVEYNPQGEAVRIF